MFTTVKSATIQMNIRFKKQIDEKTLLGVLSGHVDPKPWVAHLHSLITDTPLPHVQKLVTEHGVKKAQLSKICSAMPNSYAESCVTKINDLAITT